MKKINILTACMLGLSTVALTSCGDVADEVTSIVFDRNFAPVGLESSSVTETSAKLSWTQSAGATSYTIELFANDSLTFAGSPVKTFTGISASDIPYTLSGLDYDTKYSARVMALDEANTNRNSKWSNVYFRTSAQQILKSMKTQDVTDKTVDLSWPSDEKDISTIEISTKEGQLVTTYTVTEEDKAAGKATVGGLSPETEYVGKLYFNGRERGSKSFKTIADLNGATVVKEGDDLKSLLSNATDGEVFALMPGTYQLAAAENDGTTSSVALKTSVVIKGIYPTDKPVIQGRFEINGATNVKIDNVVLDGSLNNSTDQTFNFKMAGDVEKLVVSNTEIKGKEGGGFAKGICYINVAAKIGEVTFDNCDIHDIQCDGGDFFDSRKGYMSALNFLNCTFYNVCESRDFIRYDDGKIDKETVLTVDHCTIDGAANSKKRLLYVRNGCSKIVWSNNIVTNTQAVWTNQSKTKEPEFQNNVYFNCANLNNVVWADGKGDNAFKDPTATVADPKYKNAKNGDFTIGNEAVTKLKVGAEKWYAAE